MAIAPGNPLVNPTAEAATIGACLVDTDAVIFVAQECSPADFSIPVHRWLADALWKCLSERTPPTRAAIISRLQASKRWSDKNSAGAVCQVDIDNLMAATVQADVDYATGNAKIVRALAMRRDGNARLKNCAALFLDPAKEESELYTRITKEIGDIFGGAGARDASIGAIGQAEVKRLEGLTDAALPGITCGVKWLDELTGGLLPGECWVISAPYKMRKTTLVLNFVLAAAQAGETVTVFTNGDSTRDGTFRKLLAMQMNRAMLARPEFPTAVSSKTLQYPLTNARYSDLRADCDKALRALPIRLYDARDGIGNLPECSRLLHRDVALYGARVFVYDYAQSVYNGKDDYERTTAFAGWAQRMIGEMGITGIALSQMSEDAIKNASAGNYSPGTKGGGALPAMANLLLETKYSEPNLIVKVKLSRDTPMGDKLKMTHVLNPASGLILDGERSL